jgi:hypothetical protein
VVASVVRQAGSVVTGSVVSPCLSREVLRQSRRSRLRVQVCSMFVLQCGRTARTSVVGQVWSAVSRRAGRRRAKPDVSVNDGNDSGVASYRAESVEVFDFPPIHRIRRCNMSIPGFTGEASLYKATERYRLSGAIGGAKPNTVEPAQLCGPCSCQVRCYGSGIFRNCEFRCTKKCCIWAEPVGCIGYITIPCSRFTM